MGGGSKTERALRTAPGNVPETMQMPLWKKIK